MKWKLRKMAAITPSFKMKSRIHTQARTIDCIYYISLQNGYLLRKNVIRYNFTRKSIPFWTIITWKKEPLIELKKNLPASLNFRWDLQRKKWLHSAAVHSVLVVQKKFTFGWGLERNTQHKILFRISRWVIKKQKSKLQVWISVKKRNYSGCFKVNTKTQQKSQYYYKIIIFQYGTIMMF